MVHVHKGRAALSPSAEPSQQRTEAGHIIVHGLEMRKLTESFANLPVVTQPVSGGPQAHMQVAEPMLFTPTAQASLKPPGSLQLLSGRSRFTGLAAHLWQLSLSRAVWCHFAMVALTSYDICLSLVPRGHPATGCSAEMINRKCRLDL